MKVFFLEGQTTYIIIKFFMMEILWIIIILTKLSKSTGQVLSQVKIIFINIYLNIIDLYIIFRSRYNGKKTEVVFLAVSDDNKWIKVS